MNDRRQTTVPPERLKSELPKMITSFGSWRSLCLGWLLLAMLAACSTADPIGEKKPPEVRPLAADLHRDHGWAALHAERYKEAASYFQRVLKSLRDDDQARLGLGEAYLGQGRLNEALEQFKSLDDKAEPALQAKALQGQGIIWLRRDDGEKARGLLQQAVDRDAGLWRSWNAIGRLHDSKRDHASARQAFRKAIAINPKAALLHNNLGFSLLASGEPVYAEAALNRALELDPGLGTATTNLRLALALQGRYEPALAGISTKDRAVAMNNVGYAALLRGDHDRAKTLFRDAMAAAPSYFHEARRNLAFLETLEDERKEKP